ncbi:metallophosphoesterase family protein [Flavobacterium cerinum]|uniref:Metallophosphoesterase family protein n=1 Tax=Flavobacterium cerinum TaxID=2502784 RepID=A0ABY5IR13_9FLAO|nr:metallophosphoesterase family protein [Flavobacterium cerinum]UUC45235.1 metallophosphoesterase family protein [Flavobacterium cerinum]
MSRIAIFSDVHGNLPALKTILADLDLRKPDQVYCLGDLVDFAPWPNEVIELLQACRIPCIMGNHDERIAYDHEVIPLKKHTEDETNARIQAVDHTRDAISAGNKDFLGKLPQKIRLNFTQQGQELSILLVHGSTRSNEEYIYENHNEADLYQMMEDENADVLIMGHTHQSYIRKINTPDGPEKLALNCGSVGRSKEGEALATYLLLDIGTTTLTVELVKLPYPVEETVEAILASGIPDFYANFLLLQR